MVFQIWAKLVGWLGAAKFMQKFPAYSRKNVPRTVAGQSLVNGKVVTRRSHDHAIPNLAGFCKLFKHFVSGKKRFSDVEVFLPYSNPWILRNIFQQIKRTIYQGRMAT